MTPTSATWSACEFVGEPQPMIFKRLFNGTIYKYTMPEVLAVRNEDSVPGGTEHLADEEVRRVHTVQNTKASHVSRQAAKPFYR